MSDILKAAGELDIGNVALILLFLIPGFLSLKVYDTLFPRQPRDLSKSIIEVLMYSALNYGALSWLIYLSLYIQIAWLKALTLILSVLIMPIAWPVGYYNLLKISWFRTRLGIHPIPVPWDYVFGKGKPYWIIVHLKDGRKIGGRYHTDSFASSFPESPQIYVEEVWKLSKTGKFLKQIERSQGIILFSESIDMVEFFEYD